MAETERLREEERMKSNRWAVLAAVTAMAAMGATGCATKKYVLNQTAPLVDRTNQLEEATEVNAKRIKDTDERAQAGIKQAQGSADAANQAALTADKTATDAQQNAITAVHRVDSLDSVVKGLDDYKSAGSVTVNFALGKYELSKESREQLDQFAAQLGASKGFILEVTGSTDSTGPALYNYQLSQHRADAVVEYLAVKYGIPAHRFYLIGIGKDKAVAENNTSAGRKQNRRVTVELLTNASLNGSAQASR
jgi:outer membrane protein OmpA-like peptidoglycan-associated protein